jgi:hypothetical protein
MATETQAAVGWLLSGDTGLSSKTICAVMTKAPPSGEIGNTPSDNSDFGRCYRLLKQFPLWRIRLHEVADRFPEWGPIVAAWDELTAMYEEYCESNGTVKWPLGPTAKAAANKMYERMKEIERAGRLADGWKQDAPGSWSKDRSHEKYDQIHYL